MHTTHQYLSAGRTAEEQGAGDELSCRNSSVCVRFASSLNGLSPPGEKVRSCFDSRDLQMETWGLSGGKRADERKMKQQKRFLSPERRFGQV